MDQSQGQEADVVLVSLTNPRPTRFLDLNRLNVLFSRARRNVLLITDTDALGTYVRGRNDGRPELRILRDMLTVGSHEVLPSTAQPRW